MTPLVAKEEICHFIKYAGLPEGNEEEEERPIEPPMSYLPRFSEVTITPACSRKRPKGAARVTNSINPIVTLATMINTQDIFNLPVEQLHMPLPVTDERLNMPPLDSGMLLSCGHIGNKRW